VLYAAAATLPAVQAATGDITFGTGAENVTAGTGPETFVFQNLAADVTDTISGFRPGIDHVALQPGVTVAGEHTVGGSTTFGLSTGVQVDFAGVTVPHFPG